MRSAIPALRAIAFAGAVGAEPVTVAVTPVRVSPHSWYVQGMAGEASAANQGFMSNAGFVITTTGVVVFDAPGSAPLAEQLLREIRKLTAAMPKIPTCCWKRNPCSADSTLTRNDHAARPKHRV